MQEPTKTGRQTPKGDVEGAKLRTMSSQGRARPEPMVKYSDGAADNMYREVIHTSPKKMENMSKVVSGNKSFNLDVSLSTHHIRALVPVAREARRARAGPSIERRRASGKMLLRLLQLREA